MLDRKTSNRSDMKRGANGEFTALAGVRSYVIHDVDKMQPFFMSVISHADHWLFISSTGGLTAGRVSPESALFPYVPVDRIHESTPHTGSKTLLRVQSEDRDHLWEPFNREQDGRYEVTRNLYKAVSGGEICFEEINHDLELGFRYTWQLSDRFGFSRCSELHNLAGCRVCLREKPSRPCVKLAPPSAALIASVMRSLAAVGMANLLWARSRLPCTTASRLLKSCAMPPVNWPTASIFWAWRSSFSACLRTVISCTVPAICRGSPESS